MFTMLRIVEHLESMETNNNEEISTNGEVDEPASVFVNDINVSSSHPTFLNR